MVERYTEFDVKQFIEFGESSREISDVVKSMPYTIKRMVFIWSPKDNGNNWVSHEVMSNNHVMFYVMYKDIFYIYNETIMKWIINTPNYEVEEFLFDEFKKALVRALD